MTPDEFLKQHDIHTHFKPLSRGLFCPAEYNTMNIFSSKVCS